MTNRLAIVATALLVPPVCVGVSELALLRRGIDVATVLLVVSGRGPGWWKEEEEEGEEGKHGPFPGRPPRCKLGRRMGQLGVLGSRLPGTFAWWRRRRRGAAGQPAAGRGPVFGRASVQYAYGMLCWVSGGERLRRRADLGDD